MNKTDKHSKKSILIILAILILAVIGGGWYRLNHPAASNTTIAVSGRIESDDAAVAAKTAGRIREITVREGDQVQAGQVIAVLDDEQLKSREQQAQSLVAQAQAK